jgi:hypothetical protein
MENDEDAVQELKDTVRKSVEAGIEDLLEIRNNDPNKTLFKRILSQMLHK